MSAFWSGWVMFLVVLNLGITLFLFIWGQRLKIPTLPDGTTGHVWAHGVLREGVRRLPLWWVLFSTAMFVGGFGYLALYPGFGAYQGALRWTSAGQWQRDTAATDASLHGLMLRARTQPIETLATDAEILRVGRRLFLDNCAACHGLDARGNTIVGAPDLTDADWLYGGDSKSLLLSIQEGRNGAMPALGEVLGRDGVSEVASYVVSLSGRSAPAEWVAAGKARFATVCFACHGADGRGNKELGAPNLTDDVWLYGADIQRVEESIRNGRSGVMPAWRQRLGEERTRMIAAWVYANSLRGAPAAR